MDFKNISIEEFNSYMCDKYGFLIEPLRFLNIKHFGYRKFLLKTNTSFGFCTSPQWIKVVNKIFKEGVCNPYDSELKKVLESEDQYFWRIGVPKKNKYCEILFEENLWNTFVLYQKQKDFIEGFYFILPELNEGVDFLLKNLGTFQRFVYYFQSKTNYLKKYDNYHDSIEFDISGNYEATKNNTLEKSRLSNFLDSTPINNIPIEIQDQMIFMTKREAECLDFLSRGKTSKEIGRDLNISPRTVEGYINNLKNKSGITSKSGLIDIFRKTEVGKQYF